MGKFKIEIETVMDGFKIKFSSGFGKGSETVAENVKSLKGRVLKKIEERFSEVEAFKE